MLVAIYLRSFYLKKKKNCQKKKKNKVNDLRKKQKVYLPTLIHKASVADRKTWKEKRKKEICSVFLKVKSKVKY